MTMINRRHFLALAAAAPAAACLALRRVPVQTPASVTWSSASSSPCGQMFLTNVAVGDVCTVFDAPVPVGPGDKVDLVVRNGRGTVVVNGREYHGTSRQRTRGTGRIEGYRV
jgi:hypothetical protein